MTGFDEGDHPRASTGRFRRKPIPAIPTEVTERLRAQAEQAARTPRLVDNPEEFASLRDIAAGQFGMPQGAVEKDYWATQALRSVVAPLGDVMLIVFKGGTSLSKAFNLIERFSEDIDILVRFNSDISKRACERAFKALAARAADELGINHERHGSDENHLNARLHYPTTAPASFLTDGVLLEMGVAGGEYPNETRRVSSLMAQVAEERDATALTEFVDLAPFDVTCLAPHRTLAEKLAGVHHRATVQNYELLRRDARHIYDAAMLLNSPDIQDRIRHEPIASFMHDIDRRSEDAGYGVTPRPDSGFGHSPAFTDEPALDALRAGYQDIAALIWGNHPTFEDAINTIRSHSELL